MMKIAGIVCLLLGISLLMLTLIGSVSLDAESRVLGASSMQLVIRAIAGIVLLVAGVLMRKKGEVA